MTAPSAERRSPASADLADVPGWAGAVMLVLRAITQLVGIHVLIVLGTLAGGIVGGLAPAATAARSLTSHLADGTAGLAMWREFWGAWRSSFRRANLLALPFWGIGVLLATDAWALAQTTGAVRAAMGVALVVVTAYALVALAYLPLVAGEFDDPWGASIRYLLLAPALHPGRGCAILVSLAAIGWAYWMVPPVAVLLGLAAPILVTGWIAAPALAASADSAASD
ncbi:putative membrane protein YesL [Microbacterium terrae]|uniref:DUF624 domain-containing protein n=1 Tax=Microbacterium terrae TaxID=69369 RepID=A0A0M2HE63_9MICO|nr:DUF624 domain-containing protein [Microbacterium terrae]KJL42989.1 hypothetical protein RS81_00953 [Microbacterium terrae]MBP1079313.1 putative membrane protein YesL [Microbacterium terrae]GLJ98712.1 hypothetical protein GCM10017594_19090 [Microbacterium terrae]